MKRQVNQKLVLAGITLFLVIRVNGQEKLMTQSFHEKIMFYNVENLYDPFNDSITDDDEFTSGETRHWNYTRYRQKLFAIAKVIIAAGEGKLPVLVGLCEIENSFVLKQLISSSPLAAASYRFVHRDSPDPRGVDVALLYDTIRFKPLYTEYIQIVFPGNTISSTREILYCKGKTNFCDSLHVFVNHWPSNYGGSASSDVRRRWTAGILKQKIDSILGMDPYTTIIIMGDLNEGPEGDNLKYLISNPDQPDCFRADYSAIPTFTGSHKFRGNWETLDHIIFSNSLTARYSIGFRIFNADFLLEPDEGYTGLRPFRTFSGPTYKGGFSDHLPVLLEIQK